MTLPRSNFLSASPTTFLVVINLIVVGVLLWVFSPWPTRTLHFKEQNCRCQIPHSWHLKNNPLFIMEAHRLFGGSLAIAVHASSPSLKVDDPAFSNSIKDRLTKDGFEILDENTGPFEGHAAYAYTMRKTIKGYLIYTHSINFVDGKYIYGLFLSKREAQPMEDQGLMSVLDTFGIDHSP